MSWENRYIFSWDLSYFAGAFNNLSTYDMAEASYGKVPNLYKQMIIAKIKEGLADPESAKIEVSPPPSLPFEILELLKAENTNMVMSFTSGSPQRSAQRSIPNHLLGSSGGIIQGGQPNSHP